MGGVEYSLDRLCAMPFFALLHIISGEAQVVENAISVGPLPKQIVVLEKMVMTERGMRNDQGLHCHGIFFHDVADAGVGVDDDLVSKTLQALAVERLVI